MAFFVKSPEPYPAGGNGDVEYSWHKSSAVDMLE